MSGSVFARCSARPISAPSGSSHPSTACHAPSVTHTQTGSTGIAIMNGSALSGVRFRRTSYARPHAMPEHRQREARKAERRCQRSTPLR